MTQDRNAFGANFKQRRIALKLTLREFCRKHGFDAGNISKLERGILAPPQSEETRLRYAEALEIRPGTDEWLTFCDLAAAESGVLPSDIVEDERIAKHLPVLFRTIRDAKLSEEELAKLIELVRKEVK